MNFKVRVQSASEASRNIFLYLPLFVHWGTTEKKNESQVVIASLTK